MITVAGFNTSLDRRVELAGDLVPGAVQRAKSGEALPGGKGLHVAQTVAGLGEPVQLIGLTDAVHRATIDAYLRSRRVAWHGVALHGDLRQCLALQEPGGRSTEILEPGPVLDDDAQAALLDTVHRLLPGSDVLVLSGSLPRGFPGSTYARLIRAATKAGVKSLVDTSGAALYEALDAAPWLVKPNADEAAALVGQPVRDIAEAETCARLLHARGAANVVVTLGAQGAVAFDGETAWHGWSDAVDVRSAVGSGDCFLAAFAVGAARSEALGATLARGIACGAVNAASDATGFADSGRVAEWLPHVHVRVLRADQAAHRLAP